MNTPKLIAIFLAVFAITSHAENAAQLVATINSYNSSTGGTGNISASYSFDTVTVIGTKTGATTELRLIIDQNVTVVWKAELTGNTGAAACGLECVPLIYKGGRGLFEVRSGGKVVQTGAGYAISNGVGWNDNYDNPDNYGNITISGGTVSATTGVAVFNFMGTVLVSGDTVSVTTGVAVQSSGTVLVTGGTVTVGTGGIKYSNHTYDFVSDGTIIEWNNPSGSKTYTAFTSNDITKLPETVTVQWLNKNGKAGIGYFSNDFVEVSGVTVNKTNPTATFPTSATITYGQTLAQAVLAGQSGTGTFAFTPGTTTPTVANSGTQYPMTFTPTDAANYNTLTNTVPITVNKANPTITWPASATITYGQTLAQAVLAGQSNATAGTFAFTESTTHLTVAQSGSQHQMTFTPADHANYNTLTKNDMAVTVNKATGLENDAPPKRFISAVNTNENTYDLSLLALNKSDHGELAYALLGTASDPSSILAPTYPKLANKILTYKGTGKTSGEATQKITVTSENYADIEVTITFEATAKEEVTISGITAQNGVYDGNPKLGYAGTPASGAYTGALLVEYAGTNHPQSITRPANAGEYTIKISVPDSATYYFGVWSADFTIARKQIAKPAVTSTNLVYTGSEQSAGIAANAAYTVIGGKGTNANTYTATVALNDKANHEWSDGTTDDLLLPWEIKANTPILPQIAIGSIRVQATSNAITLENLPRNTKVQIYSLQGKQIYSANSENSQILRIPVQTKGMYVVKAGNQMVRVTVR